MYPGSNFTIEPSRNINMELLRRSHIPLPELVKAIRDGLTLAGNVEDKNIAVSIAVPKGKLYEIVFLTVDPAYRHLGYGKEMLYHTLDYIKLLGGLHVEAGAGNADIQTFAFFQRSGFRVAGVVRDHYIKENAPLQVENSIKNRDMIRYSADLNALYAEH